MERPGPAAAPDSVEIRFEPATRSGRGVPCSLLAQTSGMPVFTPELTISNGRVARLTLRQDAAQSLSGAAPWPARLEVLLGYAGAPAVRVPVELRGRTAEVPVQGRRAPDFVFANAGDYGYGLVRLDARSVKWLEAHVGDVKDDFLRAMLWGAMWDEVRAARLDPARFVRAAMRALPRENDELLVPATLGRVSRAYSAYLSPAVKAGLRPALEALLLDAARDTTRSYGVRKNHLDTYIGIAGSPAALATVDAMLDSASAAGAPLRPPTRWAIVTTLVARGAPSADARLAAEVRRDSTTEGRRRAFVAGAARPDSATKAAYWTRYFGDRELNEDWVTASLRAFHDPAQESLTRRYLLPALDSLPWIQQNRRIFFLGNWVGAAFDGQRSADALASVDDMLRRRPLPRDLREKILQSRDELERTVAIRRAFP